MKSRRKLLRFDEVREMLGCSRDHIYDLLSAGKISAHNPNGRPGTRGTKILASSVDNYLLQGEIPPESWTE